VVGVSIAVGDGSVEVGDAVGVELAATVAVAVGDSPPESSSPPPQARTKVLNRTNPIACE